MIDSNIAIKPRDPSVTNPRDQRRLSGQCVKMIRLLQTRNRVPNRDLARIALKYTSRISDIRGAGYTVVCTPDPAHDGLTWYSLRDLRWEPARGYSVTVRGESREIMAVRRDDLGRRWVIYRTPARMGVTRILIGTWRRWAVPIAAGKAPSRAAWRTRALPTQTSAPAPRPKARA